MSPYLPALLFVAALQLAPGAAALAALGDCGQPVSTGAGPLASDALFTLRASVLLERCRPPVCDADGNCVVSTSDALRILQKAVGEDVILNCGMQCQATTTSSTSSTSMFGSTTLPPTSSSLPPLESSTTTTTSTTTTSTSATTSTTSAPAAEVAGADTDLT